MTQSSQKGAERRLKNAFSLRWGIQAQHHVDTDR